MDRTCRKYPTCSLTNRLKTIKSYLAAPIRSLSRRRAQPQEQAPKLGPKNIPMGGRLRGHGFPLYEGNSTPIPTNKHRRPGGGPTPPSEFDDKYPVSLLHLATNWLVLLYDLNRYVTLGFRSPMCRPEYAGWTSISNYFCSSILATLVIISLLLFRYLLTPLKRTAAYNIAIAMESSLSCR